MTSAAALLVDAAPAAVTWLCVAVAALRIPATRCAICSRLCVSAIAVCDRCLPVIEPTTEGKSAR